MFYLYYMCLHVYRIVPDTLPFDIHLRPIYGVAVNWGRRNLRWLLLRNEVTFLTMIESDAQVLVNENFTDISLTPRLC